MADAYTEDNRASSTIPVNPWFSEATSIFENQEVYR
jgi:hypothetical protein